MNKAILLVDCDQVVADTARPWYKDLELNCKLGLSYDDVKHKYDFAELYKEELHNRGINGWNWWKQHHIYDDLLPIDGSVETLQWASEFFSVRFVSVIKGGHGSSKHDFLDRFFPFKDAVAWSKEKWMCKGDIIVDDRNENLRDCKYMEDMTTIRFTTPHEQFVEHNPDFEGDWLAIRQYLEKWYDNYMETKCLVEL